jgi:hypothetical protein
MKINEYLDMYNSSASVRGKVKTLINLHRQGVAVFEDDPLYEEYARQICSVPENWNIITELLQADQLSDGLKWKIITAVEAILPMIDTSLLISQMCG